MAENFNNNEVVIRTMDSDVDALEKGGGEMVAPQPIKTEEIKSGFNIPGYVGPEKPIFNSNSEVVNQGLATKKEGKGLKIVWVIILVLLIIVAFGFLGYFIVSYFISPR